MGKTVLQRTEECYQERYGEINTEAMEDGNDNETLSRIAGDDRQRGIHRGGATNADRRQLAEILRQQRRTQQGKNLTADVGKQSYGSQLGTPILSDEDTGQRVVSEARTDGKTVGEQAMSQKQRGSSTSSQGSENGHHRQHHQSGIHLSETFQYRSIATDTDTHAEHQAAERIIAHITRHETGRNHITQSNDDAQHEETNDNQTTFHFPTSFLQTYLHNAHAKIALPRLPAIVSTMASSPRV